jgi:hypothetical protein
VEEGRLTTGGGRLSGVDVADDDDVDVSLLFTVVVVSRMHVGYMCSSLEYARLQRLTHPMATVACGVFGKLEVGPKYLNLLRK